MLKPTDGPGPTFQDFKAMWERIRFHPEPCDASRLQPALEELRRTHCNGHAHLYRFRIPEDPIFDWYASRNQLQEMEFFERFLTSKDVREAAREINIPARLEKVSFKWSWPLEFDGQIATSLVQGGAYEKFKGRPIEAKRMAWKFANGIFENRHDEFLMFESGDPWCPWFCDIAWDRTWIILDKGSRRVWLLCLTDTD